MNKYQEDYLFELKKKYLSIIESFKRKIIISFVYLLICLTSLYFIDWIGEKLILLLVIWILSIPFLLYDFLYIIQCKRLIKKLENILKEAENG